MNCAVPDNIHFIPPAQKGLEIPRGESVIWKTKKFIHVETYMYGEMSLLPSNFNVQSNIKLATDPGINNYY